jgi:hypothetical protein
MVMAKIQETFADWRREVEAIQIEMDHLVRSGCPSSKDERLVRSMQFSALIERREAAARKILPSYNLFAPSSTIRVLLS